MIQPADLGRLPSPRPPAWTEARQEGPFHPSQTYNARLWLLQGDFRRAAHALKWEVPAIDRRFGVEANKAWHVMHAEIALAQGNFGAARVICHDGNEVSHPIYKAHPLYNAIFCSIAAEAMRREGPLDPPTIEGLMDLLKVIPSQPDDRFRFVEYAICRTIGLDMIAHGSIEEIGGGIVMLERAGAARAQYMTVPNPYRYAKSDTVTRNTYRDIAGGAQPDEDKLRNPNASPIFSAVMSLPFAPK